MITMEPTVGKKIKHIQFGAGEISGYSKDNDLIEIIFDSGEAHTMRFKQIDNAGLIRESDNLSLNLYYELSYEYGGLVILTDGKTAVTYNDSAEFFAKRGNLELSGNRIQAKNVKELISVAEESGMSYSVTTVDEEGNEITEVKTLTYSYYSDYRQNLYITAPTSFMQLSLARNSNYNLNTFYYGGYMPKGKYQQDDFSTFIYKLKVREHNAINRAKEILDSYLPDNAIIYLIPPSTPGAKNGIGMALEKLMKKENNQRSFHSALFRSVPKPASHLTGNREYMSVAASLSFNKDRMTYGVPLTEGDNRPVILLDDVSTSGTSLAAARDVLKRNGIEEVFCLVLGRTI